MSDNNSRIGDPAFTYDAKNKLVSVLKAGVTSSYTYNPDGIRDSKTEGGVTTSFVVDSNRDYAQVLLEDDGTAQVIFSYGDDLLNQSRDGVTSFFHYDGLGSTRSLSDSSGNLTDTYNYEAFGELLNLTGTTDNNYLFAGEQLDANLEQYYLRARYYDQGIGRFTQQDTYQGNSSDPLTLHKYLYANAAPTAYTDPSGHMSLGSIGAALNTAARLAMTSVRSGVAIMRSLATRVNGKIVKGVRSLQSRIWLKMRVGRVQSKLPKSLGRGNPNKKGTGWRWADKKGNGVRVDKGNPRSSSPSQKPDHVVVRSNGKVIGRDGKPLNGSVKDNPIDAHIPLSDWLTWSKWFKP